jgi:hypothetical protein
LVASGPDALYSAIQCDGRQWADLGMNELEISPRAEQGGSMVKSTSDYKRLLLAGEPALSLMNEAVRMFTERARAY